MIISREKKMKKKETKEKYTDIMFNLFIFVSSCFTYETHSHNKLTHITYEIK